MRRVLIANRGEIAVRVITTLRRLGLWSIAVYSDADVDAVHARLADEAVRIGPAPAAASYLSIAHIMSAADRTHADACHPGYGFLAESADFARACAEAGITFIGPPASAIDAMGDKITAKAIVAAAGVAVVPGGGAAGMSDAELADVAVSVGLPVMLKPSAGGGGKGMHVVNAVSELASSIATARRESASAFGDSALLVERYIPHPRHIEVQVFADAHGNVVHLGERECSLQRRHQKVIEEAPSALLTPVQRDRMGAAAVAAARSVGYVGAGTVEFIVPGDNADSFSFMEMNTRLQVEHPVTEMITGLDLVELQIAVADGQQLPFTQDEIGFDGHAVEARIYAEDPAHDFLPSAGILGVVDLPGGDGVRVDSGVESGATVGVDYDPMLAKVIAYGADRATALRRVDAALARTSILGVHTNIGLLRALLVDSDVRSGHLDTGLIESRLESLGDQAIPAVVPIVAALLDRLGREPGGAVVDPFDIPSGFRVGGPSTEAIAVEIDRQRYDVQIRGRAASASVCGSGGEFVAASIARDGDRVTVRVGDRVVRLRCFVAPDASVWLGLSGRSWRVGRVKRDAPRASGAGASTRADLRSPMPGTVTVVHADVGAAVRTGDPIVVVEAMKMEHVLAAPFDGVIADLPAQQGDRVALDALLATVEAGS